MQNRKSELLELASTIPIILKIIAESLIFDMDTY